MLSVVTESAVEALEAGSAPVSVSLIDELVREGARQMLASALRAEVADYIARFADERDENGRRLVVRNGSHEPREVLTAAGAVEVQAPRVNDRRVDAETGERCRFSSAILPPWCRKTPKINEVLPLLYLHGLSSKDFVPALGEFLGSSAGLSASVITKLTETWQAEARAFAARDLRERDYVYVWADGVHVNVRLEEHRLCLLVLVGVRIDGHKELIAITDGYRESTESWADLLRDCARRGMRAPVLAVGDGALGFWGALAEVFPTAKAQRCWFHRTCKEINWSSWIWGARMCYAHRRRRSGPTHGTVRGVAATSERASAAVGVGHGGTAARPRRYPCSRGRGRGERDYRARGRGGARGRRGPAAGRAGAPPGRWPEAGDRG
jgi:transposase-like protein